MGTRILFQIRDNENTLVASLFSNSSHDLQDPEVEFRHRVPAAMGPTALLESLLTSRYDTAAGNHRQGDRLFWLVPSSELETGDHEAVLTARYGLEYGIEGAIRKGSPGAPGLWQVTKVEATSA